MVLLSLLATLLHACMIFALAPLTLGAAAKCRARLAGRTGPPWLQAYFDLGKLLRKQTLVPETATGLFAAWPYLDFAASAAAALLVPSFCTGMVTAPDSDFFLLAGLIALARAAGWAAGLETGSGAGGAAVSRDLAFAVGCAGVWVIAVLTLTLIAHDPTIDAAVMAIRASNAIGLPLALAVAAGTIPGLAQPESAAEIRLEYSGRYLLLFQYAGMLRLLTAFSLIGAVVCPFGVGRAASILTWPGGMLFWLVKTGLLCAAWALARAIFPPLPTVRASAVLGGAALAGVISVLLLFTVRGVA